MPKKIEISYRTIVFIAIFALALWVVYQIRSIILALFVALILMSALNPSVKRLESWKFPRWLAILIIYVATLAVIGLAVGGIIPPLIEQTTNLINQIPQFFEQFKLLGVDEKLIASQLSQFTSIPANLIKFIFGFFSNIISVLAVAVITFYLLLERKNFDGYLATLFGPGKEETIERVMDKIEVKLGTWVRGELLLMTFVGLISYIGYRIIGIDYALPLAILSFIFEVIPNIGPIVSAVPAIIVGLVMSPFHGLAVVGWAFLTHQTENAFLVPKVMKKVVGINPLVSLLSMAIGFQLAGVGGAILAIPTVIVIEIIAAEIFSSRTLVKGS